VNKPNLKATLARIAEQRAALAKVRAEAEDLDDYLAAIEARARDTGERIPMATVHLKTAHRRKVAAS
jgi:predicted  nucleic acid-binding Zn-ribbon protein